MHTKELMRNNQSTSSEGSANYAGTIYNVRDSPREAG